MATIHDVAKLAGVSPATVTHTLNGKRPVSEATRKKVLKAIDEVGYVPSWSGSRLKRKSSGIIGCLAADITETFVNQIVRGVERGLIGNQYSLFFVSGVEFDNDLKKAYNFLKSHDVEGILFCHHIPIWEDFNLVRQDIDIPIVSINMAVPHLTSIIVDNITAGYNAADHLYSCGMHNPAMICGPENRLSVRDRLQGFSSRIGELSLHFPTDRFFGEYDADHGYEAATQLMKKYPNTDGIFCANDYIAAGAINALTELGYSIPDEVRVVGFDNRDFSEFWRPKITTFEQPLQEMGMLGVSLVKQIIHTGHDGKTQHTLQSRLIPRESSIQNNHHA